MTDETSGASGGETGGEAFDLGGAIDSIAGDMGLNGEEKVPAGGESAGAGETTGAPAGTEAKPAGAPGPSEAAPAPGAQPAPGTPPAQSGANPPPDTWTAEGKAAWGSLPPTVQAEVLKREGEIKSGIEDYGKRAKVGDYFAEQVAPFAELYAKNGLQVGRFIKPLLNAYATITWGDANQKVTMLKALAEDAGVDLSKVASGDAAGAVDPRFQRLQQEIMELRTGVQQSIGAVTQARHAETAKTVEAFAADTAKHPYFWEVIDDMKNLVDRGVATGLDDAYSKAIMLNPLTQAKELDRLTAEKLAQATKEAADKAKKVAKVTGHLVRSSEQGGAAPGKLGTIDDTLKDAMAEINARE